MFVLGLYLMVKGFQHTKGAKLKIALSAMAISNEKIFSLSLLLCLRHVLSGMGRVRVATLQFARNISVHFAFLGELR